MDKDNPILILVHEGMKLEKEGTIALAQQKYMEAWNTALDDHEKCIATHFVARNQDTPEETLKWNIEALNKADKVQKKKIKSYYPSLYFSVGLSYENLENYLEAKKYYDLAFEKIPDLSKDKDNETYNKEVIKNITYKRNSFLGKS